MQLSIIFVVSTAVSMIIRDVVLGTCTCTYIQTVCLIIKCSAQSCPENCGKINMEIGNIAVKSFY